MGGLKSMYFYIFISGKKLLDPSQVKDHNINQDYQFTLIWEIWLGTNKKYNAYIAIIMKFDIWSLHVLS